MGVPSMKLCHMSKSSEERKFLHDIVSPLATAIFLLDIVREDLKSTESMAPGVIAQTTQLATTLAKMKGMIEARREVLMGEDAAGVKEGE